MTATRADWIKTIAGHLQTSEAAFDDQGHAVLAFEGITLHLQLFIEPEASVLVMIADLGKVPASVFGRACTLMLQANASWRTVAGGALALDDAGTGAVLMRRLDLNDTPADKLGPAIYAFSDGAVDWHERLGSLGQEESAHLYEKRPSLLDRA